jgi:hypothetical protein
LALALGAEFGFGHDCVSLIVGGWNGGSG